MFLSKPQLVALTGYRSNKAQSKWLANNGYKFDIRADGQPVVLVEQLRQRQCLKSDSKPGPNLSILDSLN